MISHTLKFFPGSLFCLLMSAAVYGQVYRNPSAPVEERVNDLLDRMTLEEKIDYIGGYNAFYIRDIPRLNTPLIKMSDGPVGVRNYGNTTAYPAGILTVSTWNRELNYNVGQALGRDARARGVHILLAPGVNIYRAPMCGRNFEYFGEDPYLSGETAAAYISGIQGQGVVATVKHFDANNQEYDRNNVSSDMAERTLQEIYLPAFRAAVQKVHAGSVMAAYNLVNGIHCTQNMHLLSDVLKDQWGWDGFVMSDWVSTYNGVDAAKAGLDLEMPDAAHMNRNTLLPAIHDGTLSEEIINDKVRRILRILFRFGFFDRDQKDASIPLDDPDNAKVALEDAQEGIVLLKNQDSILPLDKSKISSIAVIGPNANSYVTGGGSSYTSPFHSVTLLDGIKKAAGPDCQVSYESGTVNSSSSAENAVFYISSGSETRGLKGEYFSNQYLTGNPAYSRTDQTVDFNWNGVPNVPGLAADHFSIRWTGVIKPEKSTQYEFIVNGDDGYRLWINNNLVINNWTDHAAEQRTARLSLDSGTIYQVKLEYYENGGDAVISFGWQEMGIANSRAVALAKDADLVIFSMGFNSSLEGEGFDRTFSLPAGQDDLIKAVTAVNPNTILVINAGGNVNMQSWLGDIKALLYAWYPGQEGGTAIANILYGEVTPSGKLPVSFEKKWQDNPVYDSYYDNDGDQKVFYKEGLLLGYRYYDTKNVEPQFPFGFGLSYTSFVYSGMSVSVDNDSAAAGVSFTVTNNGKRPGAEVAQVYVHDPVCPVIRPYKELKGFEKIFLQPGESKTVSVKLDSSAFSYYKEYKKEFGIGYGSFDILVGASSADIRLSKSVSIESPETNPPVIIQQDPADEAGTVQTFTISFSRPVFAIPGHQLTILRKSDQKVIENINIEEVTGSGSASISFKNQTALNVGDAYYIEIDSAAFIDNYDNAFQGLYGTDEWNFIISHETGINNREVDIKTIRIFPNPASKEINIELMTGYEPLLKVEIVTVTGSVIDTIETTGNKGNVLVYNTSGLTSGCYFVRIRLNERILSSLFLIN